jgi:hypothetical protein
MKWKPLSETNPYLRDRSKAEVALNRSVATSTAIETEERVDDIIKELETASRSESLRKRPGSSQ